MHTTLSVAEFEEIYRRYYVRLYLYASDFIDDGEVCRDIVAEVFAQLWTNRGEIDRASLEGYLRASVRNACISFIRKMNSRARYSEYIQLTEEEGVFIDSVDDRETELLKAISLLPERTRHILEECTLHEHTYKEVADELGITPSGVKQHIIKAYSFLRDYFGKLRGRDS